jgi:hypothetical protein
VGAGAGDTVGDCDGDCDDDDDGDGRVAAVEWVEPGKVEAESVVELLFEERSNGHHFTVPATPR